MARGNTELKELFRGRALSVGGTTRFSTELPLGEGWYKMILMFNHVVTIGTGAGVLSESGLRVIRGITLRSDKSDFFVNGVPGRPLYRNDQIKAGTPAILDSVAAASATYQAMLNLWFYDPLSRRPEDLIIDTSRYSALTLEVTYGTVADLYSTVGTSSVAPTLDCMIERQRGPVPAKIKPVFGVEYGVRPSVDPTSVLEILLERAANLSYKRLFLYGSDTSSSGVPFSGNSNDAVLSEINIDHDRGKPFETILAQRLRQINKQDYALETALTGGHHLDFVRDGSNQGSLYSGNKSRLSAKWVNGTLPATPQVSLFYEAIRPLA